VEINLKLRPINVQTPTWEMNHPLQIVVKARIAGFLCVRVCNLSQSIVFENGNV
jgi:hypothetical protein